MSGINMLGTTLAMAGNPRLTIRKSVESYLRKMSGSRTKLRRYCCDPTDACTSHQYHSSETWEDVVDNYKL